MRISHVITTLDPAAGGPPVVATRLAAALARDGHAVSLVAYESPGKESAVAKLLGGIPGWDRVQVRTLPWGGRLERVLATGARRALPALLEGCEIVHIHGVWDPILLAAAGAARRSGIPYVVTPHGMLDPWSLSQSRLKKRVALAVAYRSMLSHAAFLHWLNRDEQTLVEPLRLGAPGKVIGNGIFAEELADLPPRGAFRAGRPALGEAPFALFMGRLHHKKGLDILASAMRRLGETRPDLHLVVAGPDDGAEAEFRSQVERSGVAARVHVVGPLYGREKLAALVDAAVFVLPSRQEGFSIAITEAMACGLPVVVSDACHFPEVAEERCGHVVPVDAAATADAIADVLARPDEAAAMGERGRRLVLARFTWPQVARQMTEAYLACRTKQ